MSLKQAACLTSRVISLWFFCRTIALIAEIPAMIAMMSAFYDMRKLPGFDPRSERLLASSGSMVLQGIAELVLAIVFYRFGPRVAEFLMGHEPEASLVDVNGQSSSIA